MSWKYRNEEVDLLSSGGTGAKLDLNIGVETLAAARTLTAADNGKTFLLALAGGFDVTVPMNLGAGFRCQFRVKVAPTTAYTLTTATADTIIGRVFASSGGDENSNALGDVVNFVASTSLAGDYVDLFFDGALWHANGFCDVTGSITITG